MNEKELKIPFNASLNEVTLNCRPMAAVKTIPTSVGTTDLLTSVLLQVRMVSVESHLVHGKSSTRSSKIKPLNSCLSCYYFAFSPLENPSTLQFFFALVSQEN